MNDSRGAARARNNTYTGRQQPEVGGDSDAAQNKKRARGRPVPRPPVHP